MSSSPNNQKIKKRAGNFKPKGRIAQQYAIDEIKALIPKNLKRDMLIEYLHMIQDKFSYLSSEHLTALAFLMNLPLAEIWEVASFYDHFVLVKEDETPPPARTIRVCTSLTCSLFNSEKLLAKISETNSDEIQYISAPCLGACNKAPVAADGHFLIPNINFETLQSLTNNFSIPAENKKNILKEVSTLDSYIESGGYQVLNRLKSAGTQQHNAALDEIELAALRGLGGAGFPTGKKWRIVSQQNGPRLMAINADEGEPGTFKDRFYLSTNPHQMIEGILIAALLVGITDCYIYVRDEYPEILHMLLCEIEKLDKTDLANHTKIHLRRGAGAYICGEESAMIESIEGKRGLPRHRPPFVAENGIFGQPTLVNNVETLYWVPELLKKGAKWFNAQGTEKHPGHRTFSVSGRVATPGLILAAAGTSAKELIRRCGGMADGHVFKAYLPGGASGGILPADKADIALDFGGELAELGCFVGSHAVIILSDKDNIWDTAKNLMRFFKHESCGQCTPCRVGTEKAATLMNSDKYEPEMLSEITTVMRDASICGLGQAASNPLSCAMRFFPEECENSFNFNTIDSNSIR
ncbi:NAD(P)H-dependent oxidoreductase subunit E [Alphaproteobacteria bacterium]|nr:NAD(P)H-dependent oxidoreductase subunit E [Alphaproteobacteria bacterium]